MVVVDSFLPWRSFFNSNTSSKVDSTGTPHIEEHTWPLWYLHQKLDNITPQRAILHHEGGVWCEVASPLYLGLQFRLSRFQSWESLMACTPCQPIMSFNIHGCCCFVLAVKIFLQFKHEFKGRLDRHATHWRAYSGIMVLAPGTRHHHTSTSNNISWRRRVVWSCKSSLPGFTIQLEPFPILRKPFGVHPMSTYNELY